MSRRVADSPYTLYEFEWFKTIHEQFLVRLSGDNSWEFTDEAMNIMDKHWPRMVEIAKNVGIDLTDRDTTAVDILEGGVRAHPRQSRIQFPCLEVSEYEEYVYETQKTFLADFDRLILLLQAHLPNAKVIVIDSDRFSNAKTYNLLGQIVNDTERTGVPCEERTLRSLRELLRKHAIDDGKPKYAEVAKSLKWENGLARTTILFGKILITQRTQRKK